MGFSFTQFIRSQLFTKLPKTDASFAGQTVIVTGANTGLGLEAARHIVRLGAEKVIIAVRNVEAGSTAAKSIAESTGRRGVCEVWALDLSSFASVKAFATKATKLPRLDAVLENAGMSTPVFERCAEAGDHERTIAINVISTFLLALLLIPKLRETGRIAAGSTPRLTVVASDVHAMASFVERKHDEIFAALSDPARAHMFDRYPVSKLLEILMVRQVAPLMLTQSGSQVDVRLNCCNPGMCKSDLTRDATAIQRFALSIAKVLLARSQEVGGGLLVTSLAAGSASHGKFISDGVVTDPDYPNVRSEEGEETARRVWAELSEILEGIQPGITAGLRG